MISLSVNVLTSAIMMIERLDTYRFSSLTELSYSRVASIGTEDLFDLAKKCAWVMITNEGTPSLTARGHHILSLIKQDMSCDAQRLMLFDYIDKVSPAWMNRIPYGRLEATIFMTKDERACFGEAQLLTYPPDTYVVEWWDKVAENVRMKTSQRKNITGRIGEKATLAYEHNRTNVAPKWMSVDSNLLGYDIMSQKNSEEAAALLIEVKTSTLDLNNAYFYVSSHEWQVAEASESYLFYLWCFANEKKRLAIITSDKVQPYIPTNNLIGEWETARIPYICFESYFSEVE